MKRLFFLALSAPAIASAVDQAPPDLEFAGMSDEAVSMIQNRPSLVPAGVELAAIERRIWVSNHFTDNLFYPPGTIPEGKRDKMLGFLSFTPFQEGHPLYACWMPGDRFTSRDYECEGYNKLRREVIGYAASVQLPGTVPLYRCYREEPKRNNHFDSLDPHCEGVRAAVNEGISGYIWL